MSEARAAHTDRMDSLETLIRANDTKVVATVKELRDTTADHAHRLQANERKAAEHTALLSRARGEIDSLQGRAAEVEQESTANRNDIMVLQDKQDQARASLGIVDKLVKAADTARDGLAERVAVLERDARVHALQATAADYVTFKKQVAAFMQGNACEYGALTARLDTMDTRINKGHPGLWKITETVAAQAVEIAAHQAAQRESDAKVASLEAALAATRQALADHRETSASAAQEGSAVVDRLGAEIKRLVTYIDSRTTQMCAKYEVDAVRQLVEGVRAELHDAITSMGLRVKFELLHDEVPQVNTLKTYIQQTETAMARTLDRLGCLEAGLGQEAQRVGAIQAEWDSTRASLDAMVLNGTFDVGAMRRELHGFRDLFKELGRLASRGQVLTVSQAEALVDKALTGPSLDAQIARKLSSSNVLKQELSGYVPRHELEGLRRVIAQLSAQLAAGGPRPDTSHAALPATGWEQGAGDQVSGDGSTGAAARGTATRPASAASSRGRSPSPTALNAAPTRPGSSPTPSRPQSQPSEPGGSAGDPAAQYRQHMQGSAMAGPTKGITADGSVLLAVYTRLAALDQALATTHALAAGLQDKVDATARQLASATAQLDADLPAVKQAVAEVQQGLAAAGAGPLSCPRAQAAVRQLVNKTILPEVVDRQAADMQRVVRHLDGLAARAAASDAVVRELRATVHTVQAALHGQHPTGTPAGAEQPTAPAVTVSGGTPAAAAAAAAAGTPNADVAAAGASTAAGAGGGGGGNGAVPASSTSTAAAQYDSTVRELSVRVAGVERLLVDVQTALQTGTQVRVADGTTNQQRLSGGGMEADLPGQLSDLTVTVQEIMAQLPMLARTYDVEVLRKTVDSVHADVAQRLASAPLQPQLHLTLGGDSTGPTTPGATPGIVGPAGAARATGSTPQPAGPDDSRQQLVGDAVDMLRRHQAWQEVAAQKLSSQMGHVAADAATARERAGAVEKQFVALAGRWTQGMALLQEALPRMEHLASTTEVRVQDFLAASQDLMQASQLNALLPGCGTIQKLQADVAGMVLAGPLRMLPAVSDSPRSSGFMGSPALRSAKSKSQLGLTDLDSLPLPHPLLLPSFTSPPAAGEAGSAPASPGAGACAGPPSPAGALLQGSAARGGRAQGAATAAGETSGDGTEASSPAAGGRPLQSALKRPPALKVPTSPVANESSAAGSVGPGAEASLALQASQGPSQHTLTAPPRRSQAGLDAVGSLGKSVGITDQPRPASSTRFAGAGDNSAARDGYDSGSDDGVAQAPRGATGEDVWLSLEKSVASRHLAGPEHADTELSGIMHDLMHACHQHLVVVKDGPLPGAAAADAGHGFGVREAALKRLMTKPYAVQQHVELLEAARKQLDRLVAGAAISTVDYLSLHCLMLDMRMSLSEHYTEVLRDQMSSTYRNLESAFAYLKKLQEAVNSKASVAAVAAVDRCLRGVGHEMCELGRAPLGACPAGILHGTPLGSMEFWAPFLQLGGPAVSAPPHVGRSASGSPPRDGVGRGSGPGGGQRLGRWSSASSRPSTAHASMSSSGTPGRTQRPASAGALQVIPAVTGQALQPSLPVCAVAGSPYPPPTFHKDKRNVVEEQHKVMSVLRQAAAVAAAGGAGPGAPDEGGEGPGQAGARVMYVGGGTAGKAGLPVLVKQRPSTARASLHSPS